MRANGLIDFWCVSARLNDFIVIGDVRYKGEALTAFCEAFMAKAETEKAIDSL